MRKSHWLILLAAVTLPATAFAAPDHTGRLAIGYFTADAPLGGRYQVSQKVALDLGLGFSQEPIADDPTTAAPGDDAKNMELHLEAGVPLTLVERERVNFFFRPGVLFRFIPTYNRPTPADPYSKETETEARVTAIFGAEWFATDEFSLSAGEGFELVSSKGRSANDLTTGGGSTTTTIDGLQALDITRIGFHFYF